MQISDSRRPAPRNHEERDSAERAADRRDAPPASAGRIRIGCAGWSLPAAQRARFGAGDSVLSAYATGLDAVEINSSFYRPHRRATYERWAASVPARFRFSVKLPRAITHEAGLRGAGPMLDEFLAQAGGLGDKLGVLLVQLPPSLRFDAAAAARFFAMLARRSEVPAVCEPRHRSWFHPRADALLQRYDVQRAGVDPAAPLAAAAEPSPHGRVRYWRWHGSPRTYYSEYGEDRLRVMAEAVRARAGESGAQTWCVFDNTAAGHAVADALRLRELCAGFASVG
ncbi:hypothetical protein GLE_2470 [Lysobacter enzymogenes]|uniref:DUF72 domain-containing protein n=1 Tax=Lysobacter enzymogenes TaxID=69 RepID=A0A0S2DGW0_LYSEN|nr:hypothetical protein GLE_2470 [Lysobacter enzymogenes]